MKLKALLLAGLIAANTVAAEDIAKPTPPAAPATEAKPDVAKLITQLGDDDPQVRQEATEAIRKLGKAATPALTEAKKSQDLEVSSRAEALLRKIDEDSKPKPPVAEDPFAGGLNVAPGQMRIIRGGMVGGNMQIRVNAVGGNAMAISRTEANGVKDVAVEENGRKLKIRESAADGIAMSVTEKDKDGKEQTKEYKAKDLETFKKENPEAGKLYDRYMGEGGNVQFQIHGLNVNGAGANGGVIVGQNRAGDARQMQAELRKINEVMRLQLEEQRAIMEQQIQNGDAGADPEAMREAAQRMAELHRKMAEHRQDAINRHVRAKTDDEPMREALKQAELARKEAEEARRSAVEEVDRLKKELEAQKLK